LFRQIGNAAFRFSSFSVRSCKRSIGRYSELLLFLFTLFDQLPKAGVLLELFIFRHRQFRTEEEIPDSVFVEDPVYEDALLASLEVDPVIVGAIPVEAFSFALDDAERLGIEAVQVVWQKLEFGQQLQLKFLGDSGHFGRADFVEDDLIHRVSFRALAE
jgi:hypothetical protein